MKNNVIEGKVVLDTMVWIAGNPEWRIKSTKRRLDCKLFFVANRVGQIGSSPHCELNSDPIRVKNVRSGPL